MNILVTGGSGFVGRAVTRSLVEAGHTVVLPLRNALHANKVHPAITIAAIAPLESMAVDDWLPLLKGVDAVIHCAAIAHIGQAVPGSQYSAVNRDASHRMAEASRQAGVQRFVFISSIRAQVASTSPDIQSEDTPPMPTEAYGQSKLEAEGLIRQAFADAVILRPAVVIGPEARGNLDLLLRLARTGLPLPLDGFDKPQAMVSLEGLALAVSMAVSQAQFSGQTRVVADEPHPTLADMMGWIREGMGQPRRLFKVPQQVFALPLKLTGKADAFNRMTGGLRVDASRLRASGWQSPVTPRQAFVALGGAARRG